MRPYEEGEKKRSMATWLAGWLAGLGTWGRGVERLKEGKLIGLFCQQLHSPDFPVRRG